MPYTLLLLIAYFLTWLLIPYLLLQKKRPDATLAWLFAIILFPFIGPMLLLLIGPDRLRRKRLRKKIKYEGGASREKLESGVHYADSVLEKMDTHERKLFRFLSEINELPVSSIITHQLVCDAPSYYGELLDSIMEAKHHIHLQVFIWQEDHYGSMLMNALTEAANNKVMVRVLVDEIGSFHTSERFFQPLIAAGGKFAWFSSLHFRKNRFFVNLRNHRKILIIDSKKSFVGGMNIGKEYAGEDPKLGNWFDMQIGFTGALSSVLQQCFAEDWFYATNERIEGDAYFSAQKDTPRYIAQVIASGPDSARDPMHKSFLALMDSARERIWITTGYFVPSNILLTGLQMCAMRGIEVRLLVPTLLDYPFMAAVSRSYYDELLPYGIEIYETSDGIYHAKTMIVDDRLAMIGSSNFDNRSMLLNFELNVVILAADLNRSLETELKGYFSKSRRVDAMEYAGRGFLQKLHEAAVRPFAPIL